MSLISVDNMTRNNGLIKSERGRLDPVSGQRPMTPTAEGALAALDIFVAGWACSDQDALTTVFADSSVLHSSAHGEARGARDITALFSADFDPAMPLDIVTTNHFVGGDAERAVLTSYLYGFTPQTEPAPSTFGATLVADLVRTESGWQFEVLRLSIPWIDGDEARFAKWSIPSPEGWKIGDATPSIVSELDSPWARGIHDLDPHDAVRQVADFYSRYSWAIDQGDITLLHGCFTEDVFGAFPPMGDLQGRHEVIGQMKSFRRLAVDATFRPSAADHGRRSSRHRSPCRRPHHPSAAGYTEWAGSLRSPLSVGSPPRRRHLEDLAFRIHTRLDHRDGTVDRPAEVAAAVPPPRCLPRPRNPSRTRTHS